MGYATYGEHVVAQNADMIHQPKNLTLIHAYR